MRQPEHTRHTSSQAALASLVETDSWSSSVLRSLSAHIAVVDHQGTIVAVNPAWEQFARENHGIAQQCNVGTNYLEICRTAASANSDEAEAALVGLQAVLDGTADQFTMEYACPAGDLQRWFLFQVTPLEDKRGAVVSHTQITDRKLAELALRESEERIRGILENASDAIITIDERGIIQSINPATETLFGYGRHELLGQNVSMLMPEPHCLEHDGYLAHYRETGAAHILGIRRELMGLRKEGTTFPIALTVNKVDRHKLFTGIIRDISAVRDLQKQVLEIAAEENRRIGHELHDDIQQQLTGLGLLARTLAETLLEKSISEAGVAARLAAGINQCARHVHLLSRGLVPVEVDAQGLRAALSDLVAKITEQYGVKAVFQCDASTELRDNFVATHLFRIAQEAVTNAVKHGRATHIDVSLAVDDKFITLTLIDDGVGISDQLITGFGMGLKIMTYRAALIGGTIQIGRADQLGTRVTCSVRRERVVCEP